MGRELSAVHITSHLISSYLKIHQGPDIMKIKKLCTQPLHEKNSARNRINEAYKTLLALGITVTQPKKRGRSWSYATTEPPVKRAPIIGEITSHAFGHMGGYMNKLDTHRRVFEHLLEITSSERSPEKLMAPLQQILIALTVMKKDLQVYVPTSATSKKIRDVDAVMLDISAAIHSCENSTITMAELCDDSGAMVDKSGSVKQQMEALQLRVAPSPWHKKPMCSKVLTAANDIIAEHKIIVKTMTNLKRWVKLEISNLMWRFNDAKRSINVGARIDGKRVVNPRNNTTI